MSALQLKHRFEIVHVLVIIQVINVMQSQGYSFSIYEKGRTRPKHALRRDLGL